MISHVEFGNYIINSVACLGEVCYCFYKQSDSFQVANKDMCQHFYTLTLKEGVGQYLSTRITQNKDKP